ncbi:MAG: DUF3842 family protein [Ruminococcaceae bacterium]|nr:DUF3842 family protein [Oscillospiraceae bacterium]
MEQAGAKRLLILDGQGGGVGRKIAERLLREAPGAELLVVGSNAVATANMMKAGGIAGATGENAWVYNCGRAHIIVGPIGIVLANAMHGEISPAMALAVAQSPAQRVLVPVPNHHIRVAGLPEKTLAQYLDDMVPAVKALL